MAKGCLTWKKLKSDKNPCSFPDHLQDGWRVRHRVNVYYMLNFFRLDFSGCRWRYQTYKQGSLEVDFKLRVTIFTPGYPPQTQDPHLFTQEYLSTYTREPQLPLTQE